MGQSTIAINGDHALGESYCLAHHLWKKDRKRTLLVVSIRYYDKMVRSGDRWLFEERKLIIDWVDTSHYTVLV
ncbi:MAG: nuclear transport factor 2 family protein [Ktedonobacterales bacterium]